MDDIDSKNNRIMRMTFQDNLRPVIPNNFWEIFSPTAAPINIRMAMQIQHTDLWKEFRTCFNAPAAISPDLPPPAFVNVSKPILTEAPAIAQTYTLM